MMQKPVETLQKQVKDNMTKQKNIETMRSGFCVCSTDVKVFICTNKSNPMGICIYSLLILDGLPGEFGVAMIGSSRFASIRSKCGPS